MSRRQKEPLRPFTEDERRPLPRLSRSGSEPAEPVARANTLLAVAEGYNYIEAACQAGRRSGDAVSQ